MNHPITGRPVQGHRLFHQHVLTMAKRFEGPTFVQVGGQADVQCFDAGISQGGSEVAILSHLGEIETFPGAAEISCGARQIAGKFLLIPAKHRD